ncbi:hypothetical protein EVAR_69081_1 [Eumeta japonica]|uniref:Uncharacterized protein n=1 Tax=Eumeta variegata TaxID=151549 RepID=A0A4C1ZCQ0_EUMVA|nr:hypothetical protein EVAR_69081_1 [Eumeta japonica]
MRHSSSGFRPERLRTAPSKCLTHRWRSPSRRMVCVQPVASASRALPHRARVPAAPFFFQLPHDPTASRASLRIIWKRGAFDIGRTLCGYRNGQGSDDPEMDLEYTLPRESKMPKNARPSEGTSSDRTRPGSSDSPITRVSPRSGAVEPKGLNP